MLVRAGNRRLGTRLAWTYFAGSEKKSASWTQNISQRKPVYTLPAKNQHEDYFGWYSWLPSVVWNPGLELFIMVNGGTYAGHGLSSAAKDYFDAWMHKKTGSPGFWYAKKPYGPWKRFYYTDYWTVDAAENRTFQPKLSPKWISKHGTRRVLIWSDAMKNEEGKSHSVNYMWDRMEIKIQME